MLIDRIQRLVLYLLFSLFIGVNVVKAQNTNNPPPLNPPSTWPAPEAVPPGFATPPAGNLTPTPPGGGEPLFSPEASEGFDYFDEEEDFGGFGGGSSGKGSGSGSSGKSSFKRVDPSTAPVCKLWTNSLLGSATFSDKGSCEYELDRKVDQGKSSIEEMYDRIERYKLKKVIDGGLKSREEAGKYDVSFQSLRRTLQEATKSGCQCKD